MASLTVPVRLPAVAVMLALVLCGTLPEGSRAQCPSMCTCADGTVSCVGQNLKDIPKDIPADTTTLLLHGNAITEAADLQFLSLKSLKVLNISKNQLYMVEALAYEGFPGLESLDLSDNAIMQFDLNRSPALQLPFLTELRLNGNKITSIPDNAFTGRYALHEMASDPDVSGQEQRDPEPPGRTGSGSLRYVRIRGLESGLESGSSLLIFNLVRYPNPVPRQEDRAPLVFLAGSGAWAAD
ncbi:SLIT1 [Branchiostoma lanceolatum]|uniref:SLIT1 protein n=1 Tax=Branchiostoma lanceolatum TaxID=7740 RepID=A0A8J9YPP9_BRALA|nr:SLIT1 [Branchiostoma lanceolatum]